MASLHNSQFTIYNSQFADKKSSLWMLLIILLLYLLITVGYSIITPLFETPDEHWHFFTAEYIATTGKLPFVADNADEYDEWLSQEAAQPPLYYILGALLIAPIDTSNAREQVWLNPFANIGYAAATTNLNRMVHTPAEAWPWHGYALAAHLLRGFSTLLGLGTLLFVYANGRLLTPAHPERALLATALVAFLPQFNFIHAAVSNDALITFLCAAGIWQIMRLWLQPVSWQRLLLLGVTIGLAALSKNAGVLLGLYAIGVLFLVGLRNSWLKPQINTTPTRKLIWQTAVFLILPVLLIAGWLWWRNFTLYGDWTATEPFIRIAGGDRHYTIWQVLRESGGIWPSLIAIFGWFNLRAPEWIYWVWLIVGCWSLIVGCWSLTTHHSPLTTHHFLLSGWLLAVVAGLILFMTKTEAAQGRLLFPAIVPLALGMAYGLSHWRWTAWMAALLALATTVYSLFFVIRPAYALPPIVEQLPQTGLTSLRGQAVSLNADVGQGLQLIGAEIETETAVPSKLIWVTLYWKTTQPLADAPEFKIELLGPDLENPIAQLHSYHGRGLYPANLWPQNVIVADRFAFRLEEEIDTPVLARAFVRLAKLDEASPREGVEVGQVKVTPRQWAEQADEVLVQIGEGIQLTAVSLSSTHASPGDQIFINASWQVIAPPNRHLTTLIHLAAAGEPPLANGDSPPRQGSYPTTVWAAGERFDDQYSLTVPPDLANGRYPIWIGMYDSETIVPLPLSGEGVMDGNGRYLVGWIEVVDGE